MQHTKVFLKSKKKRSISSRKWLSRQLNDPFVEQAKKDGFRSRAAYKLQEIENKYKIFSQKNTIIVDLGAAPGGWTQTAKQLSPSSKIIALDINPFEPIDGTNQIIGDFTQEETLEKLLFLLNNQQVDIVLSDMAAPACGIPSVDHDRIMNLLELVLDFSVNHLKTDGHMIAKVLKGGTEKKLLDLLKKSFQKVSHFKPDSSRKESSEMYVIALNFKG